MEDYVGRFAPSPTGPLHLGSLIAALASFLDARAHGGQWLVRMEDLDPPREEPGAARAILQSLSDHGLHWDGEVMWQSERHAAYAAALDQLLAEGKAFYCTCSRADLIPYGGIYPGTCRGQTEQPQSPFAIRLQVPMRRIGVLDAIQGEFSQVLEREVGDFVLRRKDGLFAYQLAVVVDDAAQGVTHVVRGSDLLDSTPRQLWLQQALGLQQAQGLQPASGLSTLRYAHIPVITNSEGQKLSKQTFAPGITGAGARGNLLAALRFLNQPLPEDRGSVRTILDHAIANWALGRIPKCLQIAEG